MVTSDLGRLAVFATLPFVSAPALIVALAVVAGIGNGFFRPAVLAGLPNLVDDEELPDANALLQLAEWTTTAIGPLLGGVVVAASGPHLAYVLNAATFAVSAAFVGWIPARLLQSARSIGRGPLARPRRRVPRDRPVAHPDDACSSPGRSRRSGSASSTSRRSSSRGARTTRASSASGCSGPRPASVSSPAACRVRGALGTVQRQDAVPARAAAARRRLGGGSRRAEHLGRSGRDDRLRRRERDRDRPEHHAGPARRARRRPRARAHGDHERELHDDG